MQLKGRLFDGKSSTAFEAVITIDENGIVSSGQTFVGSCAFNEIVISDQIGHVPRSLRFPAGAIFETAEHEKLNEIISKFGGRQSLLHKFESRTSYVVSALFLSVAVIIWTSIWGIPIASKYVAYALPTEVNRYIAQGTMETLDDRLFKPSQLSSDIKESLTKRFKQLLPEDHEKLNYELLFRDGGLIGANAFALPDGKVIITDELVKLADNEEEIVSVLLHEIGHVEQRHSLRNIVSHASLTALLLAVTGDVNAASTLVLALPNVLLESSYSQELEWEADTYSLNYMKQHNMSTEHFANFIQRLENYSPPLDDETTIATDNEFPVDPDVTIAELDISSEDEEAAVTEKEQKPDNDIGWLSYISSHPPSSERAARFRQQPAK